MPREITTPGERQIRALFVSAGNPVLSVPDGDALEAALGELDLLVSLDLYVNETNRHADYVLPATTWLERDDLPIAFLGFYTTPFVQCDRRGRAAARRGARGVGDHRRTSRTRLGVAPYSVAGAAALARLGRRHSRPRRLVDLLLRTGPDGDRFGLRPRRAEPGQAAPRTRTASSPAGTSPPACCRAACATATRGCTSTPPTIARRAARGWRTVERRTTRRSRCG